ncbi:SMI1/KNR4 family protein [Kitasatospora viridis]|uniref:SMI1/KNR4 family protein n=1 Tax=Kitasatospora viridis TaxID=281105 RepID=UPI0011A9CD4A|nr:SMI1/KNR4 family protein [Kitasatospora viridis]
MTEPQNCPACPVPQLLDPPSGRPEEVLARVVAAAEGGERAELVGEVLLHLLDHDFHTRPAVARALVRHAPAQLPVAVERMSLYHRNRYRDPQVQAVTYLVVNPQPWEQINRLITLAYLDREWLDRAEAEYRGADVTALLSVHHEFAGLGEAQGRLALARLSEHAELNDWAAAGLARSMLLLPPEHERQVREVLDGLLARGRALGVLADPLSSLDPVYQPHAVHAALGSLRMDPAQFLEPGDQGVVAAVLASGPRFHGELLRTLWDLVRDEGSRPVFRRRAARCLGELGAAERQAAQEWLVQRSQEAAEPAAVAAAQAGLRAEVAEVWTRIEAHLAEHAPGVLESLGGPAGAAEVAELERELGMPLPVDFAASCARHRSVHLGGVLGFDVEHADFRSLVVTPGAPMGEPEDAEEGEVRWTEDDWREGWLAVGHEPDGSVIALDLDPGPDGVRGQVIYADQGIAPGAHVMAENWLALLRTFADRLTAGHYPYLPEQRALTERS